MQQTSRQIKPCRLEAGAVFLLYLLLAQQAAIPAAEPEASAAPDSISADSLMQQVRHIVDPGEGTVILHFHMTQRCADCVIIESYLKEVMETDFADDLAAGRLALRLINLDLPEHGPLLERYEIEGTTVVLTRWHEGVEIESRVLWDVWDYAEDGLSLAAYIGEEVEIALEADQLLINPPLPKGAAVRKE